MSVTARNALALAAACLLVTAGIASAQEEVAEVVAEETRTPLMALADQTGLGDELDAAGVTFSGYVNAGITHSFSDPPNDIITGRSFDFENDEFLFNQLNLTIDRAVEATGENFDVGGRLEMIYGADARFIHSNGFFDDQGDDDLQFDVFQLYADIAVPFGTGLKLRVGKFATPVGWEVVNPTLNAFYSHGFLFNYSQPLTHTGVMGSYALNDAMTVDVGITRGWDQSCEDNNSMPGFFGRLGYATTVDGKDSALYTTLMTGPEVSNDSWRTLFDFVATHQYADNVSLALNGDFVYGDNEAADGGAAIYGGLAGFGTYGLSDVFALNTRLEWFSDPDGARGFGCDLFSATAGVKIVPLPNSAIGQFWAIRPEIRYDYATDDVFDGGTEAGQATVAVDTFFVF